ncbi:hypothetical protein CEP54_009129 [Fusarium duplospermum]|uniref:Uncharacterized protein n=1 Tax=Fusarium duplospermum TaxID=1325734 RepID=A0A428PSA6_9HYPO|nr:hypothetical protein CEP54_009129 [Fusarium duplospermum]
MAACSSREDPDPTAWFWEYGIRHLVILKAPLMHSEIQTLSGPSRAYRARFSGTAGPERRPESEHITNEQEGLVGGTVEGVAHLPK